MRALGTRRRCKLGSRAFAHRRDGESFSYRRALSLSSPFFTTRCIAANKALLEAERVRKVNAEAKNQLESFIINTRDKLSSDDVMEEVGGSAASPSLLYTTLLCTRELDSRVACSCPTLRTWSMAAGELRGGA